MSRHKPFLRPINPRRPAGHSYFDLISEYVALNALFTRKERELIDLHRRRSELYLRLLDQYCMLIGGGVAVPLPPENESLSRGMRRLK